MAENIEFRLKVIEDKLGVVLQQNEKKAKSLGTALQVAIGTFSSAAAIKGLSLVANGFKSFTGFVSDSIAAASEAEEALKKLEVALSQTGTLTEDSLQSFDKFADKLEETTAFSGDLIISNAALIQSLARLDSEGLQRATTAAVDLSSALGIDLETSSRLVAKAADNNVAALQKLGLEFEKGSTDAETFANVLSVIEGRFGGSAQAQAQTFAGTITQLSNIWGRLVEEVGKAITQSPAIIAAFGVLRDVLISLAGSLQLAFGATNQDAIANLLRLAFDGANVVVLAFDSLARVVTASIDVSLAAIRLLALGITTPVAGILELLTLIPKIGESFKGAADAATAEVLRLSEAFDQNIKGFSDAFTGDTFLSDISGQIADARVNFDVLYNDIKNKGQDLKNNKVTIFDESDTERLRALNAELLAVDNEYYLASNQLDEQNRIGEKERFLAKTVEDLDSLRQFELDKSELIYQAAVDRATATLRGEELGVAKQKALREKELRDLQINAKNKADIRQIEIRDQQAFFSAATSLSNSANKELAAIGKAAAITEIAIRTPQAVASSFAFGTRTGGPVLGAALGAIAAAAMAAQAAKVAGVKGYAQGGIVGATSGDDNRIATVRDGEMILNAEEQKTLFDMIKSGGMGGEVVVQIDGREIARAVRNQLNNGYRFA